MNIPRCGPFENWNGSVENINGDRDWGGVHFRSRNTERMELLEMSILNEFKQQQYMFEI